MSRNYVNIARVCPLCRACSHPIVQPLLILPCRLARGICICAWSNLGPRPPRLAAQALESGDTKTSGRLLHELQALNITVGDQLNLPMWRATDGRVGTTHLSLILLTLLTPLSP